MFGSDRMSLKAFLDTVEERLDSLTPEQLRSVLMDMALQVDSSERREFLDKLAPPEDEVIEDAKVSYQENLLDDIDALLEELEEEMEGAEEYYDTHRWYDDEDDESNPYEDCISGVEGLLDRTNAVFDNGDLELAREAYSKLFSVFDMEDDYGVGISDSDIEGLDMKEVIARYIRSIYEIGLPEDRPKSLFEVMSQLPQMMVSYKTVSLEDLMEISTRPLPDKERFLSNWISYLRMQDSKWADYWLREAIRLEDGTAGLRKLALSQGKERPRAFLDWMKALMNEGKYSDVVEAAQQVRTVVKPDMPIRAAIADCLLEAAEKLNDKELAFNAVWEAFYAKPGIDRLLDVWNSTTDDDQRVELMQRASERIEKYLAQKRPDFWYYQPDEDDAEIYVHVSKSTLAHAYLLSRDWESAQEMSRKEKVLGWSSSNNPQGLTVICFLGLASGARPPDFPVNLFLLWDDVLEKSLGHNGHNIVLPRLKSAYEEMFADASLGPQEEKLLNWSLSICRKRATAIVENQYRGSYGKAAALTVACAEVLKLRGDMQKSQAFIAEIRNQFPRHRSFQSELRTAEAKR
jgi:soluble cytochrome b562